MVTLFGPVLGFLRQEGVIEDAPPFDEASPAGPYYVWEEDLEPSCRNPTLAKCGGKAQHLEKLEVGSLPGLSNVQSSIARSKTPRIGVFLVSLKRS